MKRQKIVTLILLMLLFTSTIQFQQKIFKYMDRMANFTENPTAAIVCFATNLISREHVKGNVLFLR